MFSNQDHHQPIKQAISHASKFWLSDPNRLWWKMIKNAIFFTISIYYKKKIIENFVGSRPQKKHNRKVRLFDKRVWR